MLPPSGACHNPAVDQHMQIRPAVANRRVQKQPQHIQGSQTLHTPRPSPNRYPDSFAGIEAGLPDEAPEKALFLQEILGGAELGHLALVEDDDAV